MISVLPLTIFNPVRCVVRVNHECFRYDIKNETVYTIFFLFSLLSYIDFYSAWRFDQLSWLRVSNEKIASPRSSCFFYSCSVISNIRARQYQHCIVYGSKKQINRFWSSKKQVDLHSYTRIYCTMYEHSQNKTISFA